MLRPRENNFEPGKQVQYDPSYTGDQFNYLHQKEERDLQDKLFELYEEIDEETNQGYGYEEVSSEGPSSQQSLLT